jgi:enoyl-CoA hydratase/carnithine racemase
MITADDPTTVVRGLRHHSPGAGVVEVVFDRPDRLNALQLPVLAALPALLESLAEDPEVRVVVLTGAGGTFCSGGDLDLIGTLPRLPEDERRTLLGEAFRATELLHTMPKPTIAAISGPAVGAGLGLALACDIRLAGHDAMFIATFVHMGLVPDFGTTWLLPRVVGPALALEMTVSGRRVGADEALATGLASRLCADPLAEAEELARRIAGKSARAVAATKQLLRESTRIDLAAGLAAEVSRQTVELDHPEFTARWASWRAAVSGDGRVG